MKGMHDLHDKENTLYKIEDYKGGYLQLYKEDNKYIVEMNIKDGACKCFYSEKEATQYYCDLYDKYWGY